ncbi:hypothetical protein F4778DRAFT_787326 [Xylariomycetidae sp. FL2044]|nr:hypothetical protein F4778DRAFT_787326 [Xylariomycetidae sp. FL2044]
MTTDASRQPGEESPTSPDHGGTRTSRPRLQLRAACDGCNHSKTKCPGGNPCPPCQCYGIKCHYSIAQKLGRPKGSKNKRTLMQEMQKSLSNGDTPRSRGQLQADGTTRVPNANPESEKSHQSTAWADDGRGPQPQLEHQLPPPAFDHGLHSTVATTYGGDDGVHTPMDPGDLFSMLDHDLLMDAITDDMSDFSHLMQSTQMTVGLTKPAISLGILETLPQGQPDESSVKSGHAHQTIFDATHLSNEYKSTSNDDNGTTAPSPDSSTTHRTSASVYSGSTAFSSGPGSVSHIPTSIVECQSVPANSAPISPIKSVSLSRASPSAAASPCTCLPKLVTLLCQLEDLRHPSSPRHTGHHHPNSPFSLKCILRGVQLAEEPWTAFMRCLDASSHRRGGQSHTEQEDDGNGHHKQALVLYAMSIRILLSSIHKFYITSGINVQQQQQQITDHPMGGTDEAAAAAISHSHQRGRREYERQVFPSFVCHSGDVEAADMLVSVGEVQLTGDTKAEIIEIAVRQALQRTTAALKHLLGRTGRPSSSASSASVVALPPAPAPAPTAFPMTEYGGHIPGGMMMMRNPPLQDMGHGGSLGTLVGAQTCFVPGQDQMDKGESVAEFLSILQNAMEQLRDGETL